MTKITVVYDDELKARVLDYFKNQDCQTEEMDTIAHELQQGGLAILARLEASYLNFKPLVESIKLSDLTEEDGVTPLASANLTRIVRLVTEARKIQITQENEYSELQQRVGQAWVDQQGFTFKIQQESQNGTSVSKAGKKVFFGPTGSKIYERGCTDPHYFNDFWDIQDTCLMSRQEYQVTQPIEYHNLPLLDKTRLSTVASLTTVAAVVPKLEQT